MIKADFLPKIPYGTKDFLVNEAQQKRLMETTVAEIFAQWGYEEVVTPTFEYGEIFERSSLNEQAFKFFDRSGNILMLRPDMTVPIARLFCTRLKELPKPIKLFYISNVFRYEQAQAGRQCEFYQAGVELLGTSLPTADAEIVALAVEAMQKVGLDNFKISLGHVDFLNGVIENTNLPEEQKNQIRVLLSKRDLAGLEEYIADIDLKDSVKSFLKEVLFLQGGKELLVRAEMLADNPLSTAALDNLATIYSHLEFYGVADKVNFDLGLIRNFSYYTGMVFETYTGNLGFPICGGGRYDNMTANFGEKAPAIGFSIGIDRLLLVLNGKTNRQTTTKQKTYIGWAQGRLDKALMQAKKMRDQGQVVQIAFNPQTKEEAQIDAQEKQLIYIES